MEKKEIITALSEKANISQKDAQKILKVMVEIVTESLVKGEPVKITGFGSFEVRERAEHEGHNPATGKKIMIPATKVPTFKAGATLKEAVKNNK